MAYRAARIDRLNLVFYHPVPVLITGAIAAVFFLAKPRLGLLIFVPSLVFVIMDVGTGSDTLIGVPVILLFLLIGLWFFDMIARQRTIHFYHSSTLTPLVAFVVTVLVAFGFGQLPWFDFYAHAPIRAQVGEIGIFLVSFGAFLWIGNTIKDLATLKAVVILFFIAAVPVILGQYSVSINQITSHFVHFAVANGSMFWTWVVALSFSQLMINRTMRPLWRILLAGILALALFFVIFKDLGWTSGWLPPLVSMVVILWFGFPKFRKPMLLAGILVVILLSNKIYSVIMVGDNQYSLSTRLAAWQIIAQIIKVDPVFGLGPANYYWFTPLFSILGYRVVFNSHNNYVDLIAQVGIVGTACFLWFSWAILRVVWRLKATVKDDFSRAYVYGVLGGWIATLIAAMFGDWLLPFVYNIGYRGMRASLFCWIFLGGLLFLERLHSMGGSAKLVEQEA
ncbi:MAG: O-antigen ligase family protein [Omnitrophica WOR_2 bacterium]